jgi:hypothetical protein
MSPKIAEFVPALVAVRPHCLKFCCSYCLKLFDKEIHHCKDCRFVRYCDVECQKQDYWGNHEFECRYMKNNKYEELAAVLSLSSSVELLFGIVFKLYIRHINGTLKTLIGPKQLLKFSHLPSYSDRYKKDDNLMKAFQEVKEVVISFCKSSADIRVDSEVLFELFCTTLVS